MLQCTDIKKQPTANIIDGNVQLHILSLIPDNFQGVTEIVSDGLPKPSRVNIVTNSIANIKALRGSLGALSVNKLSHIPKLQPISAVYENQ